MLIRPKFKDTRRFKQIRLHTYLTVKEELLSRMHLTPGWDMYIVTQLLKTLDEAIDGEISRLLTRKEKEPCGNRALVKKDYLEIYDAHSNLRIRIGVMPARYR